jgi:hypothetical protein
MFLDAMREEQVCDGNYTTNYVVKQFCGARERAREKFLRFDRRENLRRSVRAIPPEHPARGRGHAGRGGEIRQDNTSD